MGLVRIRVKAGIIACLALAFLFLSPSALAQQNEILLKFGFGEQGFNLAQVDLLWFGGALLGLALLAYFLLAFVLKTGQEKPAETEPSYTVESVTHLPNWEERNEPNPLLRIYNAAEDQWYAFFDWLNNYVPVYSLIDPIDKVIPSFVLFILLVLALIGGLLYYGGFFAAPPGIEAGILGAQFLVQDAVERPIAGAQVAVAYDDQAEAYETNGFGEFELPTYREEIFLDIQAEGFERFSGTYAVARDGVNLITLKGKTAYFAAGRILEILNERGEKIREESVRANFSCSGSFDAPPTQTTTTGQLSVPFDPGCGTLTATVMAQGYFDTSLVLNSERNVAVLRKIPSAQANGKLNVKVMDSDGAAVAGVDLRLFDSDNIWRNTGKADSVGTYSFSISPGSYYAMALDPLGRYDSGQSNPVEVGAGEEKTAQIQLNKKPTDAQGNVDQGQLRQVSLKVVDRGAQTPVQGANVDLYLGGLQLVSSARANSDGLVVFSNADKEKSYALVVTHPSYVMKIQAGVQAQPLTAQPQKIELDRAAETNSGEITVQVNEFGGGTVPGAEVLLYNKSLAVPVARDLSSAEGAAVFGGLPPGNYYAVASKGATQGKSAEAALASGQEVELPVELVLKTGKVEVTVKDAQGNAVQGAKVEFINVLDKAKAGEAFTDGSGVAAAVEMKVDVRPYLAVSKAGFYSKKTAQLELTASVTRKVEVVLTRESEAGGFAIQLKGILSEDLKPARLLAKNTAYWLRFSIVVPDASHKKVQAVVRTGLDTQLDAVASLMVIREVRAGTAKVVKSLSFDPADNYVDKTVTAEDAKLARVEFGDPGKGEYELLVKVYIKNTSNNADRVDLRYGTKAEASGQNVEKPPAPTLYLRTYTLGELIACDAADAGCTNFVYAFQLSDPSGRHFAGKIPVEPGKTVELLQEITYSLEYQIFNAHKQGKNLPNTTLSFINADQALEALPPSVNLQTFDVGTSVSGSVNLSGRKDAAATGLLVSLNSSEPDSKVNLSFKVQPRKLLNLQAFPASLTENTAENVVIQVKDAANNEKMAGALVKLARTPDFANPLAVLSTDSEGLAYAQVPALASTEILHVSAKKALYAESVGEIPVRPFISGYVPDPDYDCVSFNPKELNLVQNFSGPFTITANNCPEDVDFYLYEASASPPMTLESNSQKLDLLGAPNLQLGKNASANVKVIADKLLGEYAVFLRAKFRSKQNYADLGEVRVFVQPSDPANECFALDKTFYDVFHKTAPGTVTNNCYVETYDLERPNLGLSTSKVGLASPALTRVQGNLDPIAFTWTAHAKGTLEKKLGERGVNNAETETWSSINTQASKLRLLFTNDSRAVRVDWIKVYDTANTLVYTDTQQRTFYGRDESWNIPLGQSHPIGQVKVRWDDNSRNVRGTLYVYEDFDATMGPVASSLNPRSTNELWVGTLTPEMKAVLDLSEQTGGEASFTLASDNPRIQMGVEEDRVFAGIDIDDQPIGPPIPFSLSNHTLEGGEFTILTVEDRVNKPNPNQVYGSIAFDWSASVSAAATTWTDLGTRDADGGQTYKGINKEIDAVKLQIGNAACDGKEIRIGTIKLYDSGGYLLKKITFNPKQKVIGCADDRVLEFGGKYLASKMVLNVTSYSPAPTCTPTWNSNTESYTFCPPYTAPVYKVHALARSPGANEIRQTGTASVTPPKPDGQEIAALSQEIKNAASVSGVLDASKVRLASSNPLVTLSVGIPGSGGGQPSGCSLSFDGGDYVQIPHNASLSPSSQITVATWVKVGAASQTMIRKHDYAWLLEFGSGSTTAAGTNPQFVVNTVNGRQFASTTQSAATTMADGAWHHLAATYDATEIRMYVDGAPVSIARTGPSGALRDRWNGPLYLGRWPQGNEPFTGAMDDTRVYNTALSASDIQTLYAQRENASPASTNLVAHYTFNECSGQTVADSSGKGNNGTLGGSSAAGANDPAFQQGGCGLTCDRKIIGAIIIVIDQQATGPQPASDKIMAHIGPLSPVYPVQSRQFHVRLKAGEKERCYGSNGLVGVKGESALPKVLYSWDAGKIKYNTCSKVNGKYVFCDSVQNLLSVIDAVIKAEGLYRQNKFEDAEKLLHDEVYLMKDGYPANLLTDLDNYLLTQTFFTTPSAYSQGLKTYFTSGKLAVRSDTHPVTPLPSSGVYKRDIIITFPDGKTGKFMENGLPIASIAVKLERQAEILPSNVLERLPLDGQVGGTARNGYGVLYSGAQIPVTVESSANLPPTVQTGSNNIARIDIASRAEFPYLNMEARGRVFNAKTNPNGVVDWIVSPSQASPILMRMQGQGSKAEAVYKVTDNAGNNVDLGTIGSLWTGVASNLAGCRDFLGRKLFYNKADKLNPGCAANSEWKNYGFSITPNSPADGKAIYARSVFYAPVDEEYGFKSACGTGSPLFVSSAQALNDATQSIGLTHEAPARTLNQMLDYVKQGRMCLNANANEATIWWNEDEAYKKLKANYDTYFALQETEDPHFEQCSAVAAIGSAKCQGTAEEIAGCACTTVADCLCVETSPGSCGTSGQQWVCTGGHCMLTAAPGGAIPPGMWVPAN